MKSAYEKWLVSQVQNDPEDKRKETLARMLLWELELGCHAAFYIVEKVQDKEWSWSTFQKAAESLLKPE